MITFNAETVNKPITDSQQKRLKSMRSSLNSVLPDFTQLDVVKIDPYTKSLLVTILSCSGIGQVWVGIKGAVRDIDGNSLMYKGRWQKLPVMK